MTDFPIRVIVNPGPAVAGARRVRKELKGVETRATSLTKTLKSAFAFAGLGIGLNQLKKFSDGFIEIQNRLRIAGFATNELNAATQKLIEISIRTRSPLEANAKLLGRIGIAANDLGASQEDMFRVIELVGKGLAVQGSSAQEARGAIIQLSQAFGSGTVRAEEFNSVAEGAAPILQAVAKSMGVTFSQLKRLVASGKVASKEFFQALIDGGSQLDAQFKQVSPTIGQVFEVVNTVLTALVGTLEQNFGVLSNIAGGLLVFAGQLPVIVPILVDIGIAIVGMKLALFAQGLITAAIAGGTMARTLTVLAIGFPRAAAGVTLLTTALNFLRANPIVALITAAGFLITLMFQFGDSLALSADGAITLGSVLSGLVIKTTELVGSFGAAAAAAAAFLAVLVAFNFLGIRTAIAGMVVNLFSLAKAFIAARAAALWLNPFALVIAASAFAIFQIVDAVFQFKDALIELFPPAEAFFTFVDDAIKGAIKLWNDMVKAIKGVVRSLGLLGNAANEVAGDIRDTGNAAASAAAKAKTAAKSTTNAYKATGIGIATDFANASNSASGSLNTLAKNASSVASNISASMKSAAGAVAGVKFGGGDSSRGLVGTGTGTSINTGGSKTATVGIPGFSGAIQRAADIASLVGGTAVRKIKPQQLNPGDIGTESFGGFNFGVSGADPLLLEALKQIQKQLGGSRFGPGSTEGITSALVEEFANERLGRNPDGTTDAQRRKLGLPLLKSSEALSVASVALQTATADLSSTTSDFANNPIFLSGNPFEAFRQNVFGFAKGGSFEVGGAGGADSQLVKLALTPGERVDIMTPKQQKAQEEAKVVLTQNVVFNIETPDVDSFRRSQTQIVGKTLNTLKSVERRL